MFFLKKKNKEAEENNEERIWADALKENILLSHKSIVYIVIKYSHVKMKASEVLYIRTGLFTYLI